MPRLAAHVIEKDEAEDQPALLVDRDVAPIANARHEVQESRLELLPAAPLARVVAGGFRIGSRLAGRRRLVSRSRSVFEPIAVVRERIDALAVVLLHAGEVHVRRLQEIGARHPLRSGNRF